MAKFVKGNKPWNFGIHFSEASKQKMSEVHKKNPNRYWLGKKRSQQTIEKMRKARLGKKLKPHSFETRKKIGDANRGENSPNWKGGVTPTNNAIRHSFLYKIWRDAVFKRDDYTCQICAKRGGIMQADHILPFSKFPSERFNIQNGRTLCVECHKKTETYGGRSKWRNKTKQ